MLMKLQILLGLLLFPLALIIAEEARTRLAVFDFALAVAGEH